MDTLEYMSKLLGKGTFDKRTTGHSKGKSGSSSYNFDVVGRDLLDTAEIRKLPKENCLFVVGGRNPFYSFKYDYTSHPNYRFTSDANHSYSFEYELTPPPKAKKLEEENPSETRPHREDEKEISELSKVDTAAIMEGVNKNVDEIEMTTGNHANQTLLTNLSKNFSYLAPVLDELQSVEDGEDLSDETRDAILDLLDDKEANAATDALIEAESVLWARETMKKVNEVTAAAEIEVIFKPKEIAFVMLETRNGLAPVSDEEHAVNDGEDSSSIGVKILSDIMLEDDSEEIQAAELNASMDDLFSGLSSMIDILPKEMTEFETVSA